MEDLDQEKFNTFTVNIASQYGMSNEDLFETKDVEELVEFLINYKLLKKLTVAEMIKIIDEKTIEKCSPEEKEQVMVFAFGEDFMESEDKGSLKYYAGAEKHIE